MLGLLVAAPMRFTLWTQALQVAQGTCKAIKKTIFQRTRWAIILVFRTGFGSAV